MEFKFEEKLSVGRWSFSERILISYRLLKIVVFFPFSFRHKESCHIVIQLDNTFSVAFITQ